MDGVLTPIFLRLGNRNSLSAASVGRRLPRAGIVENVTLSNIQAVNAGAVACSISGYPGHYVKNVKLSNIDLAFKGAGTEADLSAEVPERSRAYPFTKMFGVNLPAYGLFLRHVRDITIDGLSLRPPAEEPRPELAGVDVHGLRVTRFKSSHPKREEPRWKVSDSTDVQVNQ
jgi:hypothetical protein